MEFSRAAIFRSSENFLQFVLTFYGYFQQEYPFLIPSFPTLSRPSNIKWVTDYDILNRFLSVKEAPGDGVGGSTIIFGAVPSPVLYLNFLLSFKR